MLTYFKKYLFFAYALAVVAPMIIMLSWSVAAGENMVRTTTGLVSSIGIFMLSLFASTNIMARVADAKADQLISLYNDSCNPEEFVKQSAKVVRSIAAPYSEAGSRFLSFYALALADLGRLQDAASLGDAMRESAKNAKVPQAKASLLVNLEPVVRRLLGPAMALSVVHEAQQQLDFVAAPLDDNRRNFLTWEKATLEAMVSQDNDYLLERRFHVRTTENYPIRMRVLAAAGEAKLHRLSGDEVKERTCLLFVVEHGNTLPEVQEARLRLAKLG